MPWNVRTAVEQRRAFVEEWQQRQEDFGELCRRHGIARQTGYKWVKRFEAQGLAGLEELSRAPHDSPQAISADVAHRVIELREQHPRWGPRKLRAYLHLQNPDRRWPATSSIGELLQREGLVQSRRLRRRVVRYSQPLAHAQGPNQVWCADFKGWFTCGNGERCDPLTISDAFSRYLLRCRAVEKTDGPHVRGIFEAVFRECGLPEAIRTDNGPPFAGPAPAGLSRLSMWWLRLGIRHERIEPGCPEQNGRHERMHQTLKQETAMPPAANLQRQQESFIRFQNEYNQQRPHEALSNRTPGSLYVASARRYPARLPEPDYPPNSYLCKVHSSGQLAWRNREIFISKVMGGEHVALAPAEEGLCEVYYGPLLLGWLDEEEGCFVADQGAKTKRRRTATSR